MRSPNPFDGSDDPLPADSLPALEAMTTCAECDGQYYSISVKLDDGTVVSRSKWDHEPDCPRRGQ